MTAGCEDSELDREWRVLAAQVKQMIAAGRVQNAWQLCIDARLNLLVSGGTSTGQTTFARALLGLVDPRERIVTFEDAAEIAAPARQQRPASLRPHGGALAASHALLTEDMMIVPDATADDRAPGRQSVPG